MRLSLFKNRRTGNNCTYRFTCCDAFLLLIIKAACTGDHDEEGLLLLGLQYHKLCCLCDLDLTHNSYNACKLVPYMSFAYRDLFSPDLDLSVFFGPGLSGIMQAIEHLNKQLRSKMDSWEKVVFEEFLTKCL